MICEKNSFTRFCPSKPILKMLSTFVAHLQYLSSEKKSGKSKIHEKIGKLLLFI